MMATVATEYNSPRTVEYSLHLIRSLFGATCQKALTVVAFLSGPYLHVKKREYVGIAYNTAFSRASRKTSGRFQCFRVFIISIRRDVGVITAGLGDRTPPRRNPLGHNPPVMTQWGRTP